VSPAPRQARAQIVELRKLDLRLGGPRLGAAGKNVEDQARAVQELAVDLLLDVFHLDRRQLVVEDDEVGVSRLHETLDLLHLPRPHEGRRVGTVERLRHPIGHVGPRRSGQVLQLVQVIAHFPTRFLRGNDPNNDGGFSVFGLGFRCKQCRSVGSVRGKHS
jgi:hypothetical protein